MLLPEAIKPQLATLAAGIPSTGEWLFEIKFDGYRVMARLGDGKVGLVTRGGHDWQAKMPTLVEELATLGLESTFLDGEIVVLGGNGNPDFNALQNAFDKGKGAHRIVYFVFDAPFFQGQDLREMPLRERRRVLQAFFKVRATEHVRFSADFPADAASILRSACQMQLEGVIAKRADAPYVSRRSETWLKLKCKLRQAIVQHLAKTIPSRLVAKSGPSNRAGKLFVDYLRIGHGATTAAAFSARVRPGMGVSMPVGWEDLASLKSGSEWNVRTARDHLSFQTRGPWDDYWKKRQGLAEAMKRLGFKRAPSPKTSRS